MARVTMRVKLERKIDDSYDIVLGKDLEVVPQIGADLCTNPLGSSYAIVTDSNVLPLYAEPIAEELRSRKIKVHVISFPAGETSKTEDTVSQIRKEMYQAGVRKDGALIAVGGGVVGDVAAFAATTHMRGIPYIQVPTTLLAQADSSIGGKTGVDTDYAKNSVGRIVQPKRVYIDVGTLRTLSDTDMSSGLAETVKHAVIQDAEFFDYLRTMTKGILERNPDVLLTLAHNNCRIKRNVVEQDPDEYGLRRILNYGHTVGHAVETLNHYAPDIPHGYAVAMGMTPAGMLALEFGFSNAELDQQQALLEKFGLPTRVPERFTANDLIPIMRGDKKAANGKARFCLPSRMGSMNQFGGSYAIALDERVVKDAIERSR